MSNWPTVTDVESSLSDKAAGYRESIARLREQLRDEGKDAVDPGHAAGANDIKFNIECAEHLLSLVPQKVLRVVVYDDVEDESISAIALVSDGSGGAKLDIRGCRVLTMRDNAPLAPDLLACSIGDDTPLGKVIHVADSP